MKNAKNIDESLMIKFRLLLMFVYLFSGVFNGLNAKCLVVKNKTFGYVFNKAGCFS